MAVLAVVALTSGAILCSGAAAADGQDDQFLALLSQEGIPAVSGVPDLVNTAHQVCRNLDAGMSGDDVVAAMVHYANTVTPGADPGRLARTEARFVLAATRAYCPGHQVTFTNPAGWNGHSFIEGATPANPNQPLPQVPDAQMLTPPQAVAPTPPKKAPPVVGPPPGGSGGGGGNGGGTGGVAPPPPMEPGIITLAP